MMAKNRYYPQEASKKQFHPKLYDARVPGTDDSSEIGSGLKRNYLVEIRVVQYIGGLCPELQVQGFTKFCVLEDRCVPAKTSRA